MLSSSQLYNTLFLSKILDHLLIFYPYLFSSGNLCLKYSNKERLFVCITDWSDRPILLHGHFSYFNPRKLGIEFYPIYINIIRFVIFWLYLSDWVYSHLLIKYDLILLLLLQALWLLFKLSFSSNIFTGHRNSNNYLFLLGVLSLFGYSNLSLT